MAFDASNRNTPGDQYAGVPLVVTSGVQFNDPTDPDGRFELSLTTAERCRDRGVPFIVADTSHLAGGEQWVADALRARKAVVLSPDPGHGGIAKQRQTAASYAFLHGAKGIASYEADKVEVINHHDKIVTALVKYDAVAIGRTAESLRSLPPVQQRTEEAGGFLFEKILAIPADAWSGVRAFTDHGVSGLLLHPSDKPGMNNWTWLYSSVIHVQDAGMSVGGLALPFLYPEAMTALETGNEAQDNKRAAQFVLQARWAHQQPRIHKVPGALALSTFVMEQLAELPEDPAAVSYKQFAEGPLPRIEAELERQGYKPVGR
jgi:hypothetical protein